MHSMTGFGKSRLETPRYRLKAEIKSVNSRFLDLNYRLPKLFNSVEKTIRDTITSRLHRGKVDLYMEYSLITGEQGAQSIEADMEFIDQYVRALESIRERYHLTDPITLDHILKPTESIQLKDQELDETQFKEDILGLVSGALDGLIEMRQQEGENLKRDLKRSIASIQDSVEVIEQALPEILAHFKADFRERILELTEDIALNEDRLETEIALFIDKKDVNEELVRIESHLSQARDLLEEEGPIGRNLDFLAQELNREINTIGSKSSGLSISAEVITLKTTLEQFREQIQNVE